jgi:hypothetical protein
LRPGQNGFDRRDRSGGPRRDQCFGHPVEGEAQLAAAALGLQPVADECLRDEAWIRVLATAEFYERVKLN